MGKQPEQRTQIVEQQDNSSTSQDEPTVQFKDITLDYTIISHKPVRNSFEFLVNYKNMHKPDEWLKKANVNKTVLDDYILQLPNKSY